MIWSVCGFDCCLLLVGTIEAVYLVIIFRPLAYKALVNLLSLSFLQVIQREERARQQEAHSVTLGQPANMLPLRHFAVGISMDTP